MEAKHLQNCLNNPRIMYKKQKVKSKIQI